MQTQDFNIDQKNLFMNIIRGQHELREDNLIFTAWAAALASRSEYVLGLVAKDVRRPNSRQMREIQFAVNRMGVTNPYFLSRQFVEINAGGTLDALNFRPLADINVKDEVAYHYACVVVSLINGGQMCLRSHIGSLKSLRQSDVQIDTAMRLAAAAHSLRGDEFNNRMDEIIKEQKGM